jgi:hypothetical protein
MIAVTGISKPLIEDWRYQTKVLISNAAPNNHNAGELLISVIIESRLVTTSRVIEGAFANP